MTDQQKKQQVVIIGGGMGGLVLALALRVHCKINAAVYEQAPSFDANAGGAIGLYPNGLRVLRDIHPDLLGRVRDVSFPYLFRRWMRHDGTEVAVAEERVLLPDSQKDTTLQSVGIRRWRLQQALVDFCDYFSIPIHYGKRLDKVVDLAGDGNFLGPFECRFLDGSVVRADVVFGADGVKSMVRESIFGRVDPEYTGITCLMGASPLPRGKRGICFPSSATSKCHACFYPTGPNEQIFQIYFPTTERPETWGVITPEEAARDCRELAQKLQEDGWSKEFIDPVLNSENVIRVGLRARDPLEKWAKGRVVLLGDAAHPPVPYIGQGAMMAIEDAGIMSLLIKHLCMDTQGTFSLDKFDKAIESYESMRITRTRDVLGASKGLGQMQQNRAEDGWYNLKKEWSIWWQVKRHGTLPVMFKGARYNYADAVRQHLQQQQKSQQSRL